MEGNYVLNDAWIYTPSASYGSSGSYSNQGMLAGATKYACRIFLKVSLQYLASRVGHLNRTRRTYSNTLIPLSADFNSKLFSDNGTYVHELLYSCKVVKHQYQLETTGMSWVLGWW